MAKGKSVLKRNTSELTDKMAQDIPYWPEVIKPSVLAHRYGVDNQSVACRVASCHDRYLIFNDNGNLSRLKPDLSNCI
jgi:S-adenosylmethionine hydrolase